MKEALGNLFDLTRLYRYHKCSGLVSQKIVFTLFSKIEIISGSFFIENELIVKYGVFNKQQDIF